MRKGLILAMAAIVLAGGALAGPGATSVRAAVGPGEDRQMSTPTGWWFYTGIDAATVSSKLTTNNARLTDIKVEGGGLYTVAMVKNTGSYATQSWWYPSKTAAEIGSLAATNNARVTVIQGFNTAVGLRFAAIMIANTGANAEAWAWYYGTQSYIQSKVTSSRRMVSLGRIQGTSYYTAVFGSNTGTDATGWWPAYNMTMLGLLTLATANNARLVDLDRNSDTNTFNAVLYSTTGTNWHSYVGYSAAALNDKANQYGNRLFDVTPYTVGGAMYFAALSVDNLNAASGKLRSIIEPVMDSGTYGFYLKQVGGSTLASLQASKQYEPASALKVLYHAKSIHEEALGNSHDSDSVSFVYDESNPTKMDICPDNFSKTSTTSLKDADQQMMWNSDNRKTKSVFYRYGGGVFVGSKLVIESYGATLGLTGTQINHNIGCGTPHNKTTLVDLGRIYEAFQNGLVTGSSTWQATFRSRMLNQSNYAPFKTSLCAVVNQEATSLGRSAAVATDFCNAITWIAKGGDYTYGDGTESHGGASLTGLPYKSGGEVAPKFFVFGEFVDGVHIDSDAEGTAMKNARARLYREAMRPYIRAALWTW